MIVKKCIHHGDLHNNQVRAMPYKGKKILKCIACETLRSKKYAEKNKDKLKKKDKEYWQKNKSVISAKRKKPEKIAKRKEWHKANKERLNPIYRDKQREYRHELADTYIKRKIINGGCYLRADQIPPEMVELARINIHVKRRMLELRITKKIGETNGQNYEL